jgi:glycyl-tRNA synthetase beta chain
MENLLLEIGTEEIPAGYIAPALDALRSSLLRKLTDARIEHGNARVYGTPRRLAVTVEMVAARQRSVRNEVVGPPAAVGFDENGRPATAAIKFAQKVGVDVKQLGVKNTARGSYLYVEKVEKGMATRRLLRDILPQVVLSTPFPKKMRWADLDLEFARPIHSIVVLLGKSCIGFQLGNVKSGRHTRGHSFMSPAKIKLAHADDYLESLHSHQVIADIEKRRKMLEDEIDGVAKKLGGRILPDADLVDIVTNLVEYPLAVAGRFDEPFLEVPDEVLINAMREHQKYFSVVDGTGKLMPCFIAVNNTKARDMGMVAVGHERVLRARLADARFFYQGDLKVTNDQRIEKLKGVLFQADLGTMYEKSERVAQMAQLLAAAVDPVPGTDAAELKKQVARAARLSKSDLVSQVVGEFPKLQGVMGRIYAAVAGEPPAVAAAVEEHYRPLYSGAELPQSLTGAIVSIADKMDSICGCFHVGLIPTGASDPYALRRQGIGIIQIMKEQGFAFSLHRCIEDSARLFNVKNSTSIRELVENIYAFLQNRISHLLIEDGFSKDVVAAVISVSGDDVPSVWQRVAALEALKDRPDFEPLAVAFKRVVNIIKKSGIQQADGGPADVVARLFEDDGEAALLEAYQRVEKKVSAAVKKGLFDEALIAVASLRDPVDHFFDAVMVMAEDKDVRRNRLALLGQIAALFGKLADFSKLST